MENLILTDPMEKPEAGVLENALGKNYKRFVEFINKVTALNFIPEWRYYNDGKCWLGKILHKKKNLCWLSVWNTGFKLTFYFTEITITGIQKLEIDDETKNLARNARMTGKFHTVIILVSNKQKLNDSLKILEYKMALK